MNNHDNRSADDRWHAGILDELERTFVHPFVAAAWRAARAGWIPLWSALAFFVFMRWIGAAFVNARCDGCTKRIPHRGCKGLLIHLHTMRVNVARHWGFCSHACRERWLGAGSAEDLHPIVDDWVIYDPVPFASSDGEVQLSVIYDDGPSSGAPGFEARAPDGSLRLRVQHGRLVASVALASPQAVNAWWRTPVWITPGVVEVVVDERQAA